MRTEAKKQWWQQLGGMSQGMLFLQGHIAHPDALSVDSHARRERPVRDAAATRRHERAVERLSARRLRAMTSLSLFR